MTSASDAAPETGRDGGASLPGGLGAGLRRWLAGCARVLAWSPRARLRSRGWLDESTGLCNAEGFLPMADQRLARMRRDGQRLSLLVIDFADLLEVREIYGRQVSRAVLVRIVSKLRQCARAGGFVARTGPAQFALLLPGCNQEQALQCVHRVLGSPTRVEFEHRGEEIVLVPDVLAQVVSPEATSVQRVHLGLLERIRNYRLYETRRRRYLQRERERHSKPMSL